MLSRKHLLAKRAIGACLLPLLAAACSPPTDNTASEDMARADVTEEEVETPDSFPGDDATPSSEMQSVDNDTRSRKNHDGTQKIVGGERVTSDFADTVGIARAGSTVIKCTGTLIEPDIVLTAAHCACPGISGRVFVGNSVQEGGKFYEVARKKIALQMVGSGSNEKCAVPLRLKQGRDLALLLLAQPVTGVAPRRIGTDDIVNKATSFRAVGFGAIDRRATINPREKRHALIVAASNSCAGVEAGAADENRYGCQPNDEIVAGALRDKTDTCNGDSGGPLYLSPQGTGRSAQARDYLLAGVTSRASSLSKSMCGDGGVYERLNGGARTWIANAAADLRAKQ